MYGIGYGALTNVQFDLSIRGVMVSKPALKQDAWSHFRRRD